MIKIVPVVTSRDRKKFIDFPHELYQGDPNYVPELFIAQRDMLRPDKHPFYAHAQVQPFVAMDENNLVVGRIAAIVNHNHIKHVNKPEGFFGFFDCVENENVARVLLDSAMEWLKAKKLQHVVGPVNFSTNDPCGLLIDGFHQPPQAMMTYNKPYYREYLERYGFHKRMDLYSYWFTDHTIPERVMTLARNIESRLNRNGITIRTIDVKRFKEEVRHIKKIYNDAWDKNWGFVPMTDKEFDYLAKDLKLVMDKDFVLIAEKNNEMIGFSLTLPNINEVLIQVKRGRLLPTGIFKLLFGRKKIKTIRVLTLGVLEPYRMMGIEACFYTKIVETARRKGIKGADASWILENNEMMNRELRNIGSQVYKTHRLYNLSLTA